MTKSLIVIRSTRRAAQLSRHGKGRKPSKGKGSMRPVWSAGLLYNPHAWWLGVQYSNACHRWCINLVPCLTFWVRGFGGHEP